MKRPRQDSKILSFIKCISVAVLFTGAAILFFACENDIEKIKAFSSTEDLPMAEIIDFNTTSTLSLRDERVTNDSGSAAGTEIGVARIYDFVL